MKESGSHRWVALFPVLALLAVLFGGGLSLGLLRSFGFQPLLGESELTLRHYSAVLSDPDFLPNLGHTLLVAAVSTTLSAVLGLAMAAGLLASARTFGALRFLLRVPVVLPHLVAAFMVADFLSQGGILARLLYLVGVLDEMQDFPPLVNDRHGVGVILVYVWKEAPFVALMVLGVLDHAGRRLAEAARTLGASRFQTWTRVLLPLAWPATATASLFVFAYDFGAFEVPYLVDAAHPSTMAVWAFRRHVDADLLQRPEGVALCMIIAAMSLALVYLYVGKTNSWMARRMVAGIEPRLQHPGEEPR